MWVCPFCKFNICECEFEPTVDDLKKDLKYAIEIGMESLLKHGHNGSNQEDRENDRKYDELVQLQNKYALE